MGYLRIGKYNHRVKMAQIAARREREEMLERALSILEASVGTTMGRWSSTEENRSNTPKVACGLEHFDYLAICWQCQVCGVTSSQEERPACGKGEANADSE